MSIIRASMGSIPALIVEPTSNRFQGEMRPAGTILFFHGFQGSKESNLRELQSLAEAGFIAVGIDNAEHGERRLEGFEKMFSDPEQSEQAFLNLVWETAQNVPRVMSGLVELGLLRNGEFGFAGISMGAYVTYAAITLVPEVPVAVAMLGSPRWKRDLPESPHRHLEKFSRVQLLSQTAGRDIVVPSQYVADFHESLSARYKDYHKRFVHYDYPQSEHMMNEEDWSLCWKRAREWFTRRLKG